MMMLIVVFLLTGVVFVLVASSDKLKILQKMWLPSPKDQSKQVIERNSEDPIILEALRRLPVIKQKKHGQVCKSRSQITRFKPIFKNRQSAPKLVYMAYYPVSCTVVLFTDLYLTYESNTSRLFEINNFKEKEACFSLPLHCKGLFVFPTPNNNVIVCNPATKQVITLPHTSQNTPRTRLKEKEGANFRVGFGFIPSTQAFKVAHFFYRSYDLNEKRYSMGFEVFTIGVSSSWRVLAEDPPYPIWASCWTHTGKCIYFQIWYDPLALSAPNVFLCFNLKNEKFTLLYPPYSLRHLYVEDMVLTSLLGGLCLSTLTMNNTRLTVFTSRKGTGLDWMPRFSFSIVIPSVGAAVIPIAEHQGKVLIRVNELNSQWLACYDSKDGSYEEVVGESEDLKMEKEGFRLFLRKPWFHVSSYEESLFKFGPEPRI